MTDSSRELPGPLQQKVAEMPEYSYGVNRVVAVLDNGSEIHDVYIGWASTIVKVGGSTVIPFDVAHIVDVRHQP
jgi:hypothetical protein